MPRFTTLTRARSNWWVAPLMAAASVVIVAVVLLVTRGADVAHHSGDLPASGDRIVLPATIGSGGIKNYILRDGDIVSAVGEVVAIPGRDVRFCAPRQGFSDSFYYTYCQRGVTLRDANLTELASRSIHNGVVHGWARITGRYASGVLVVTAQAAAAPAGATGDHDKVPCPTPNGGWPHSQPSLDPIEAYANAHPRTLVDWGYLNPRATESVVYVLAARNPAPVQADLQRFYGRGICVAHSRYSQAEVRRARATVMSMISPANSMSAIRQGGGYGFSPDGQVSIRAAVAIVDPAVARRLDSQPKNLIQLQVWLVPRR